MPLAPIINPQTLKATIEFRRKRYPWKDPNSKFLSGPIVVMVCEIWALGPKYVCSDVTHLVTDQGGVCFRQGLRASSGCPIPWMPASYDVTEKMKLKPIVKLLQA
jgi:hypothetical protein